MTTAPMRTISNPSLAAKSRWNRLFRIFSRPSPLTRTLAQVRTEPFSELWFTAAVPYRQDAKSDPSTQLLGGSPGGPGSDHKPPDERTVKLGQTLRTLSPLLPDILTTPLPPEIISPHISLHLFPSTHPHLPVVKGRIPYRAALWTTPLAWGSVPYVGNVKLEILSEKIVRSGYITAPSHVEAQCDDLGEEKLVVRWRTGKSTGTDLSSSSAVENGGINRGLSTLLGGERQLFKDGDGFTGLFVFSFDGEGRVANHTIEHADEAGGWDKTSKVVTLTDWLLGKARWRGEGEVVPGLACRVRVCREDRRDLWRTK